jgi:hypothetical protein
MRTYDYADDICYVRLGQRPAVPAEPPLDRDECHRLPADYANVSVRDTFGGSRIASARPALVLLSGGSAAAVSPAPAASAVRLVQ